MEWAIIQGRQSFSIFPSGGGGIIWGTAIIQGNIVYTDLWYDSSEEKKVERLANLTVTIPTVLTKQKIK